MPSSVMRSIKISGQSVMVAIRATTGRFSLSTTALALMDLNVSGASCIAITSQFLGRQIERGLLGTVEPTGPSDVYRSARRQPRSSRRQKVTGSRGAVETD